MAKEPKERGAFSAHKPLQETRDLRLALLRGWRRRCPSCGGGALLRGYLKVRDNCPSCGEALHHQRADDGPAYLTILVVGHIMAPLVLYVFVTYRPDPLVMAALFSALAVGMSLWLLPRLKGALVGLQWGWRMHGFGDEAHRGAPHV